jgi:hypothetical protein
VQWSGFHVGVDDTVTLNCVVAWALEMRAAHPQVRVGVAAHFSARVAQGGHPAATRNARKSAPTVAELVGDFLANVEAKRKPTTALEYRRIWKRHVEPELGTTLVVGVTTA